MGDLLITIEKQFGGETWSNTHCFRMNGVGGPITDTDMTALGVTTAITAANTASGAAVNPITRLIAFERLCTDSHINFTRVYVTDGKRNDLQVPDYFWSTTFSIPGLAGPLADPNLLVPGTVALVINRVPTGFTSRLGRLFIRGWLQDINVRFNMRGGVDWTDTATASTFATAVASNVTNSGLNVHLNGGSGAAVALYSIPHYLSKKAANTPHEAGQLIGSTPVVNFSVSAPRGRQMLKGKKRTQTAFG